MVEWCLTINFVVLWVVLCIFSRRILIEGLADGGGGCLDCEAKLGALGGFVLGLGLIMDHPVAVLVTLDLLLTSAVVLGGISCVPYGTAYSLTGAIDGYSKGQIEQIASSIEALKKTIGRCPKGFISEYSAI